MPTPRASVSHLRNLCSFAAAEPQLANPFKKDVVMHFVASNQVVLGWLFALTIEHSLTSSLDHRPAARGASSTRDTTI